MKYLTFRLALLALGTGLAAAAASPRRLTIDPSAPLATVPEDFAGLSFETADVLPDAQGVHLFRPDNTPLVATFRTLGIHSLRIGGNTADRPSVAVPTEADTDSLFAFARAVDAKVIYTLRLRQSDPSAAVPLARYISTHYAAQLACFAIGNEPNVYAKTYPEYVALLKTYLAAITAAGVAPNAVFCGPSTTPGKAEWARNLATDFGPGGRFVLITQHEYVGGNSNKVTDVAAARERLLAPAMTPGYEKILNAFVPAARAAGLPYRFEETNSYYNGGAKDVSNTLAAALWAVDYLHWWAAHGAQGINFHTGDWVAAGEKQTRCWYGAFWNTPAGCEVHPIAYALQAFAVGGHGREVVARLDDGAASLAGYAVAAPDGHVYVTIVNRDHGPAAAPLAVAVSAGALHPSRVIGLGAASGDIAATDTVTFGAAAIGRGGAWHGVWTPAAGDVVTVAPASVLIVDLAPRAGAK